MLLHMDFPSGSPGLYGTDASKLLDGIYSEASNIGLTEDPSPTVTGNVIYVGSGFLATGTLRKSLPATLATVGAALRLYLPGLPGNDALLPNPFNVRDISNSTQVSFAIRTDGRLSAYRGYAEGGTLLGTSAAPAAIANAWQHWEFKVFSHASTGTIEVRVDGVVVLSLTGQNTGSGLLTQWAINSNVTAGSASHPFYVKDIIIWDTTGSFNNNFMGSCSVKELIPDGDISANWAVTGSATHYGAVNEAPPDDDTKYIYAVTPAPAADVMGLTGLPVDVTSVRGLMVINRSKNTDGGDGKLQMGLVSGASTQLYTDRQITTAYTYWTDISETDPATAAPWLPGAVNNVNLWFNRTL